jgi:hypothetical protein
MSTTITTKTIKTYRLSSADWIYTPNLVRLAVAEFPSNPEWSIKLFMNGFSLSREVATALVSRAIPYQVIDEAVVFEY